MEILPFEPEMAAGVARCYNDLVAGVPHCYPVSADEFSSVERLACPLCREESLLAARDGNSEIRGFVQVGAAAPRGDEAPQDTAKPGIIRFLAYAPGQRFVGQALLEAAEAWMRERGRPAIIAWSHDYTYSFYHLPLAHLSDRIGNLHPLLGLAGYHAAESEVLFDWRDYAPPRVVRPAFDLELRLQWQSNIWLGPKAHRTALTAQAMRSQREVGRCKIARAGEDSPTPNAADWCFCYNLHVEESLRGRGLGKFLLATGLAEMRQAGCRHAAISTDAGNYRAYLFYTNFGYSFCDRTFAFRKEL